MQLSQLLYIAVLQLEEIMEKETYKKAKEILEKFATVSKLFFILHCIDVYYFQIAFQHN